MNWYKISNTCPLAFEAFKAWYMKEYPGYAQFEVRGDEEENQLIAGVFDVPDSDACLAEVIDPRDCYDFFDSLAVFITLRTNDFDKGFQAAIEDIDYLITIEEHPCRRLIESAAFEKAFSNIEKQLSQSKQTVNNN